jgi:hypothetical protein
MLFFFIKKDFRDENRTALQVTPKRSSRVVRVFDCHAKVATVLGFIPASSDTVESELLNKVLEKSLQLS